MKKKAIILLVVILNIYVFFCSCIANNPSAKKQVEMLLAEMPTASQFIADNNVFFELLLDIRTRIELFNAEGIRISEDFLGLRGYTFRLCQGEMVILVNDLSPSSSSYPMQIESKYDLLTTEEKDLIKRTLIESIPDNEKGIHVTIEPIIIEYYHYERAYMSIENPAKEFEHKFRNSYEGYWSSFIISNDWSIVIHKLKNN